MHDIFFKCQACGQDLVVDDAGAGLAVTCPVCKAEIVIPGATQALDDRLSGPAFFPRDRIAMVCKMPLCCKHFFVPASMAGKTVRCPCCQRNAEVPRPSDAPRQERLSYAKVVQTTVKISPVQAGGVGQ